MSVMKNMYANWLQRAPIAGPSQRVPFLIRHFAQCKPPRVAPSVRVPVLPATRTYLRAVRAAELAAWEAAVGHR